MRIWSFHPRYLDTKGLGGVWCETLLAKAVLEGKTKGYKHHPQLNRFRDTSDPVKYISTYLHLVHSEATKRGFKYDGSKVGEVSDLPPMAVTKGQLEYEWKFLLTKLKKRSPEWLAKLSNVDFPDTHPIFEVVEGGIASWEVIQAPQVEEGRKKKRKVLKESDDVEKKSLNSNKKALKADTLAKKQKVDKDVKDSSEMTECKAVADNKITRNSVKAGAVDTKIVQQKGDEKSTKRKSNGTPTTIEVTSTKRRKLTKKEAVGSDSSSENSRDKVVAVRKSRGRTPHLAVK